VEASSADAVVGGEEEVVHGTSPRRFDISDSTYAIICLSTSAICPVWWVKRFTTARASASAAAARSSAVVEMVVGEAVEEEAVGFGVETSRPKRRCGRRGRRMVVAAGSGVSVEGVDWGEDGGESERRRRNCCTLRRRERINVAGSSVVVDIARVEFVDR
jgi:hypothetical protein